MGNTNRQKSEEELEVSITSADGSVKRWDTISDYSRYDAVHVSAGAILAGAEKVTIKNKDVDEERTDERGPRA